jgi:AraC-like DNA-binding protein
MRKISRPNQSRNRQLARGPSQLDLWVRPLQCVPDLLRELDACPEVVFRKVGIDPEVLVNPNNRLDMAQVGTLVAECVAATGCEHFGLLVGQRSGAESVGIVHDLMPFTRTPRHALSALRTHMHLHNRGGTAALLVRPGRRRVELAYVTFRPNTPATGYLADIALAVGIHLLRRLFGARWAPDEVRVPHRRPEDVRPYRRFFRAPVLFDAPRAAIAMPEAVLSRPLPQADVRAEAAIRAAIAFAEAAYPEPLPLKLRRLVSASLLEFEPSLAQLAQAFSTSPRTLRRRLAEEGTTVSAIIDETRAELARQLIVETCLPVQEIAMVLHYSEASAFSRAFKSWHGATPQAARAAALRAAAGGRAGKGHRHPPGIDAVRSIRA